MKEPSSKPAPTSTPEEIEAAHRAEAEALGYSWDPGAFDTFAELRRSGTPVYTRADHVEPED